MSQLVTVTPEFRASFEEIIILTKELSKLVDIRSCYRSFLTVELAELLDRRTVHLDRIVKWLSSVLEHCQEFNPGSSFWPTRCKSPACGGRCTRRRLAESDSDRHRPPQAHIASVLESTNDRLMERVIQKIDDLDPVRHEIHRLKQENFDLKRQMEQLRADINGIVYHLETR
jgi:hypothetical protein